jgi:hypothetical protein
METSPLPMKGRKFRSMLSALGLWAGRDLYHATPAVTRDVSLFSDLIRRTAPFSRLLWHTRCGGSILTRILTGYIKEDWLFIYCFTSRSKKNSLIWRRHHYRWRAAKFRPMLGTQGLWAGRDLYRATPAVTWVLGISCLIQRTASFSQLYDTQGDVEDLF